MGGPNFSVFHLHSFPAREEKLNSDNRSTLDNFQADLSKQLDTLCNLLAGSTSRQCKYLQCVENLCNSFIEAHNKVHSVLLRLM